MIEMVSIISTHLIRLGKVQNIRVPFLRVFNSHTSNMHFLYSQQSMSQCIYNPIGNSFFKLDDECIWLNILRLWNKIQCAKNINNKLNIHKPKLSSHICLDKENKKKMQTSKDEAPNCFLDFVDVSFDGDVCSNAQSCFNGGDG